jgi:hypothetical protein
MPVMAYSPLGGPGANLLRSCLHVGAAHGCSASLSLGLVIRCGNVIAIPNRFGAVKENAVALH